MNLTSWLILAGAVVVFVALVILVLALRYRKVGPNEALIIAGGRKRAITLADGTKKKVGYRYRLGGGVFVWPGMEKVYVLPMDIIPVTIRTPEVLTQRRGADHGRGLGPGQGRLLRRDHPPGRRAVPGHRPGRHPRRGRQRPRGQGPRGHRRP